MRHGDLKKKIRHVEKFVYKLKNKTKNMIAKEIFLLNVTYAQNMNCWVVTLHGGEVETPEEVSSL